MTPQRMIPFLWARLVALLVFVIVVGWNAVWWALAIGVVLLLMTGYQLYMAYQSR
ncbi:hypothetical protein G7Y31_05755 [Corynebacterium lizhenjunii]|uniref:Uncharacterized protein n=1 Tax=Corynebacterium lizhenjunii TaxID=2709394 RepID=A0A7T0KGT1_9CORY|nr:hypothetical protein [Corynebacterium lizhenjunii]QPK80450.1 hypothetical protein G7Y31_05755 [Corynebacterium lizhenjunii]